VEKAYLERLQGGGQFVTGQQQQQKRIAEWLKYLPLRIFWKMCCRESYASSRAEGLRLATTLPFIEPLRLKVDMLQACLNK
jgi:hypothetical protein